MLAAISSAKNGNKVVLIEKNNILGKKMLITGKGRCNITSSLNMEDFIKNIPGNGKFLYSSFQNFTNQDMIEMLKKNGLEVKEICVQDGQVTGVKISSGEILNASKVILATGGKSYPLTGSDGAGYKMAEKLGHTINPPVGSLVPLTAEQELCQSLQGLSLRNVKIKIKDTEKNKNIYEDFGEMLFTHFGVSGPTIMSGSAHLLRYKNLDSLLKDEKIKLVIDLKPALDSNALDMRIRRDFEEFKNKEFKNSLEKLLPQKLIPVIIQLSGIKSQKRVNEITREERLKLVNLIKNFEVVITGFRPVEEAIVTAGGVSIKEINPKTMESKIVSGLYFAGEIIDVDAYTGGFNLQIAYSTGYTAGIQ